MQIGMVSPVREEGDAITYGDGKKQLTRDQHLLEIFGPRPTSVVEAWSGPVSVQGIWSVSTSVEDVDAPTKVPGGIRPCDYVGGQ